MLKVVNELIERLKKAVKNKDWETAHEVLDELKLRLPIYAVEDRGNLDTMYFKNLKDLLRYLREHFEDLGDDFVININNREYLVMDYETFEDFLMDLMKEPIKNV